jgi:hypothetical protein
MTFSEALGATVFPLVRDYLLPEIRHWPGEMNLGLRFKMEVNPLSIGGSYRLLIIILTTN